MSSQSESRVADRRKLLSTVSSIWIQCTAGSSYAFGIYSPVLKSSQSYDQSTLDTVSVFKDIGANAGIFSGLLYSSSTSPPLVHLIGSVLCFSGYFFLWSACVGIISRPPVPITCIFMFLAAHSQTFFNTSNVVTALLNFPNYGGTIVGIMKGGLGLGGPILIQLYQTICYGEPSTFLLILALFPTLVSLSLMSFVRVHQIHSVNDKKYLNSLSVIMLLIAAYLMVIIILGNLFNPPQSAHVITLTTLMILIASPLMVVIKAYREDISRNLTSALIQDSGKSQLHDEEREDNGNIVEGEASRNILEAVRTWDFWLLFISTSCGMGSGLATINNMSQLGESLGYTRLEINTLVSLWGIWNFVGRFGAGYISDLFLQLWGWPRPILMAITLGAMSLGHTIIAFGSYGSLYIGSVVIGICYGSQWLLMPTISTDIFGVRHVGTIFNTIATASPVGSYILSVRVIGYLYDKEAFGGSCVGTHCFMLSFFVMAWVCLLGVCSALTLFFRTRKFYRLVEIRKMQEKH